MNEDDFIAAARTIPGFERYEATNDGRIFKSRRWGGGFFVRTYPSHNGYSLVQITGDDGRRRWRRVHVLVLLAFVGPKPSPRHIGAHRDRCRSNNRIENLRWATPEENEEDKKAHGTATGGIRGTKHPSHQKLAWIRRRLARGESYSAVARHYGMHRSSVSRIARGLRRAA